MNDKFLTYLLKRFLMALLTIFLVIAITFFVMHAIPASPFSRKKPKAMRLSPRSRPNTVLTNRFRFSL